MNDDEVSWVFTRHHVDEFGNLTPLPITWDDIAIDEDYMRSTVLSMPYQLPTITITFQDGEQYTDFMRFVEKYGGLKYHSDRTVQFNDGIDNALGDMSNER